MSFFFAVVMELFGLVCEPHQFFAKRILSLHCGKELFPGQFFPVRRYNRCIAVMLLEQRCRFGNSFCGKRGMRQNDTARMFDLIEKKFPEVSQVHLAFFRINDRTKCVQFGVRHCSPLNGADDVGQLSDAGRFDDNPIGRKPACDFPKRLGKIAHERTADATGVHFRDFNTRFPQKSAVDADLPEFVFDQNDLFSAVCLTDQFFNERCLSCAQKTGKNINFHRLPLSGLVSQ